MKKEKPDAHYDSSHPIQDVRCPGFGSNIIPDRVHPRPQEVTYSGNVRFSGVLDDLSYWVPGSG